MDGDPVAGELVAAAVVGLASLGGPVESAVVGVASGGGLADEPWLPVDDAHPAHKPRTANAATPPALAEGLVLAAIRGSGLPLQRIRPALHLLSQEFGLTHALASQQLFSDGAEVIYDYANKTGDDDATRDLIVVRNGQRVFAAIVEEYLQLITFGEDGSPRS